MLEFPENVLAVTSADRAWNGVRVTVTGFHCSGRVLHELRHSNETRLSVVLDEVGGVCEPRLRPTVANALEHVPRQMHFAPAGLMTWGFSPGVTYVRDATLCLDLGRLAEHPGLEVPTEAALAPRMRFRDDALWTAVQLLAAAVTDPDPSSQLYGDGLALAIAARLFSESRDATPLSSKGLAPWRLRRVIDYLDATLPDRVELARLADVAGLSPAHFSRAFKVSTGMSPHRWQLDARVRRAQAQLLGSDASLDQIATATGFADAVHFGKTFRKFVGTGPGAWRRDRKV